MGMRIGRRASIVLWVLALTAACQLVCAQYPPAAAPTCRPPESGRWRQSFTLYIWTLGQSGDVVVRGRPFNVDISVSDTISQLKNLKGAFTGHYEASKGVWTILADLYYVKLQLQQPTALGTLKYEPAQWIAELGGAWTAYRKPDARGRVRIAEVLGGLRYSQLKLSLTSPAGGFSASGSQSWIDPFIGGRVRQQISSRWAAWLRGDIGGFGIGNASEFTWNVILGFQYKLSNLWAIDMGWRWLDYDYETGSGTSRFEYDVLMSGPFVGFQYRF